jgi:hypothetical protein
MNSKAVRYWSIIAVSVALTLATTIIVVGADYWSPSSSTPPPPPTPGPPPTPVPYEPKGGEPVRNRDEAIERALLIDSDRVVREQPLTPDMIIVERYATRQEAADVYTGGGFGDPEVASEPVWVVRIKGKVCLRMRGVPKEVGSGKGCEEADGVTYVISQKTGYLLAISGSAQTWSETLERLGKE